LNEHCRQVDLLTSSAYAECRTNDECQAAKNVRQELLLASAVFYRVSRSCQWVDLALLGSVSIAWPGSFDIYLLHRPGSRQVAIL